MECDKYILRRIMSLGVVTLEAIKDIYNFLLFFILHLNTAFLHFVSIFVLCVDFDSLVVEVSIVCDFCVCIQFWPWWEREKNFTHFLLMVFFIHFFALILQKLNCALVINIRTRILK